MMWQSISMHHNHQLKIVMDLKSYDILWMKQLNASTSWQLSYRSCWTVEVTFGALLVKTEKKYTQSVISWVNLDCIPHWKHNHPIHILLNSCIASIYWQIFWRAQDEITHFANVINFNRPGRGDEAERELWENKTNSLKKEWDIWGVWFRFYKTMRKLTKWWERVHPDGRRSLLFTNALSEFSHESY